VKTALENSGKAIMGTGIAIGDDRAMNASQSALDSPLLDENSIEGSKHILINISFGNDEPYASEIDLIIAFFQQQAGQNANLKYGLTKNDSLDKEIAITLVATGFDNNVTNITLTEDVEEEGNIEIDFDNAETVTFTIDSQPKNESQPINIGLFGIPNTEKSIPVVQQEAPVQRNLNDLDTPAYLRQNVILEEPQAGVDISSISLEEDKDNRIRFRDNGNKYLHDNVD
jgi:cell division protein FtsZ